MVGEARAVAVEQISPEERRPQPLPCGAGQRVPQAARPVRRDRSLEGAGPQEARQDAGQVEHGDLARTSRALRRGHRERPRGRAHGEDDPAA
eukprot:7703192-Alexandrium_andersonii.AAC.1